MGGGAAESIGRDAVGVGCESEPGGCVEADEGKDVI